MSIVNVPAALILTSKERRLLGHLSYCSLLERIWNSNKLFGCIYFVCFGWIITLGEYILYRKVWRARDVCADFARQQVRLWEYGLSLNSSTVQLEQIGSAYHHRLDTLLSRLEQATVHISREAKKSNRIASVEVDKLGRVLSSFMDHLCLQEAAGSDDQRVPNGATLIVGNQFLVETFNLQVIVIVDQAIYERYILEKEDFVSCEKLKFFPALRLWLLSNFNPKEAIEQKSLDDWLYFLGEQLIAAGLYFPGSRESPFCALKDLLVRRRGMVGAQEGEWERYIARERTEYLLRLFSSPIASSKGFMKVEWRLQNMRRLSYCIKIAGTIEGVRLCRDLGLADTDQKRREYMARFQISLAKQKYPIVKLLSVESTGQKMHLPFGEMNQEIDDKMAGGDGVANMQPPID
jgi:hypothetical protein